VAKEFLLDDSPLRREYITPGEDGVVTLRTQYRGTEDVLDQNARERCAGPTSFTQKGVTFTKAASIPMEVYEQMTIKLGRQPTARELLDLAQARDYAKLRTIDAKL
jgi:hypothetical protein